VSNNFDKIRAMSIEEMAKLLADPGCPDTMLDKECTDFSECDDCWLKWLQSPVNE